jgi:hypothetical protein
MTHSAASWHLPALGQMIERIRILNSRGSGHPPMVPSQRPPSTPTTNNEDVPRVPPASTTARQAANQREEVVQGRCRYRSPGHRVRRLIPRDSSGRFSGGGSWADIMFGPPISGGSQATPERLRRRLGLATSPRSVPPMLGLFFFPGMNRLRKTPRMHGRPQAPGRGRDKTIDIPP